MGKKNNIELMCSVGELADLFNEPRGVNTFLDKVVNTVSHHMLAEVCSIYLFQEKRNRLVLHATSGLNASLIGHLSLSIDEGLVGLSLREQRSILEDDGIQNPNFIPIQNSGEEPYKAFLAVPILRGMNRIGVLAVQHREAGYFNKKDGRVLKAIASQLASTLENARVLMSLQQTKEEPKPQQVESRLLPGKPINEGVARGRSFSLESTSAGETLMGRGREFYGTTLEDFHSALSASEKQLKDLQEELNKDLAEVASMIFSAHLLMLKDESFSGEMERKIQAGEIPCEAVKQVVNQYIGIFSSSENSRLQEKVQDVKDLGHRLLMNLSNQKDSQGNYRGQIVIARELLPSELIKLSAQKVEGLVLYGGGASAHISILASSLGVNLIYTEDESVLSLPDDLDIILDGNQGNIVIQPDDKTSKRFDELIRTQKEMAGLEREVKDQSLTSCGKRINLLASINLLSDIRSANRLKADGIGLYRSEFPFLIRNNFPTEEEQYRVYLKVAQDIDRGHVTMRTLDIGGDKILSYVPEPQGDNPFLGLRALRFLLQNKKIFVGQLKSMLRAGIGKDLRIMFPLVSSLDDFLAARRMVHKSMEFLDRDSMDYNRNPKLGVMVELPSAVLTVNELARECDFLSIGTNDLVQYLLGVDRTNSSVASLYQGEHPAVLRAVSQVVAAAEEHQCQLSLCGNLSSDPRLLYIFIGMGIENFSVAPRRIPELQNFIAEIDYSKAKKAAQEILKLPTTTEVTEFLEQEVPKV